MTLKKLLKVSCPEKSGVSIAEQCLHANTVHSRLVGLLNHKTLSSGEALLLDPCNQIHTFFMRFPIDAVFLNRRDEVVAIREMKPWRMSKLYFSAKKVLELPLGTCREKSLNVGDKLEITPCSS